MGKEFENYGTWDGDEFTVNKELPDEELTIEAKKITFAQSIKSVNLDKLEFKGTTHLKLLGKSTKINGKFSDSSVENLQDLYIEAPVDLVWDSQPYELERVECPNATKIGKRLFLDCDQLKDVSFDNAKIICSEAFSGCHNLQNVLFPEVTEIQKDVFYDCKRLKKVSFPAIKEIKNNARIFPRCYELENVEFPNLKKVTGYGTFKWCHGKNFYAPNFSGQKGVTDIMENFENVNIAKAQMAINKKGIKKITMKDDIFKFKKLKLNMKDICSNVKLFSESHPLPKIEDITQEDIGNCWFMAPLKSIVKLNPQIIKNCFKDKGETVTVTLYKPQNILPQKGMTQFETISLGEKPLEIKIKKSIPTNTLYATAAYEKITELKKLLDANFSNKFRKFIFDAFRKPNITINKDIEDEWKRVSKLDDAKSLINTIEEDKKAIAQKIVDRSQNIDENRLWVKILEKAFTVLDVNKKNFANYKSLQGGAAKVAMAILTGKAYKNKIASDASQNTEYENKLFEKIKYRIEHNSPVTALYKNHEYAVLDIYEKNGQKFIEIIDPNSPKSTHPEIKMNSETGTCKMEFNKFAKTFEKVSFQRMSNKLFKNIENRIKYGSPFEVKLHDNKLKMHRYKVLEMYEKNNDKFVKIKALDTPHPDIKVDQNGICEMEFGKFNTIFDVKNT